MKTGRKLIGNVIRVVSIGAILIGQLVVAPVVHAGVKPQIAAAPHRAMALKSDGTVWSWGSNSGGQIGDGTYTDRSVPVRLSGLNNVTAISVSREAQLGADVERDSLGVGSEQQRAVGGRHNQFSIDSWRGHGH